MWEEGGGGGVAPLDVLFDAHFFKLLPEHAQNLHQLLGAQQGFLHDGGTRVDSGSREALTQHFKRGRFKARANPSARREPPAFV